MALFSFGDRLDERHYRGAQPMTAKGWHSRGYLPHFNSPETAQFLTFRLFDSLPAEVIEELRLMDGVADADRDAFLDAGSGHCWLRQPGIVRIVEDALLHFDGERYRLIAWTVMPNHVHALIEPIAGHGLESIVSSWKRFSARMANRVLGHTGPFRQDDYWTRTSATSGISNRSDWPWGHARLKTA